MNGNLMYGLPRYFDEKDINKIYTIRSQEIINESYKWEKSTPSKDDKHKIVLLIIDPQISFCNPLGSLYVPNAEKDMLKLTKWIYKNIYEISDIYISLDTHFYNQIFHPLYWRSQEGKHPEPFTIITSQDVRDEKWMPEEYTAIFYLKKIELEGKNLIIWDNHCLKGDIGNAIVPCLHEAIFFHSCLRNSSPILINKGEDKNSEMYSIFSSENNRNFNNMNIFIINTLALYDEIYIAGEAKSHCVKESLIDIQNFLLTYEKDIDIEKMQKNSIEDGLNLYKIFHKAVNDEDIKKYKDFDFYKSEEKDVNRARDLFWNQDFFKKIDNFFEENPELKEEKFEILHNKEDFF